MRPTTLPTEPNSHLRPNILDKNYICLDHVKPRYDDDDDDDDDGGGGGCSIR